jgi:hypothetical protein
MLEKLGVMRVELEGPDLSKRIAEAKQLDAVLDGVSGMNAPEASNARRALRL